MDLRQGVVVETVLGQRPWPHVLDQNVGFREQLSEPGATVFRPDVELQRPLAPVQRQEARALAVREHGALPAVDVPFAGALDLEDVRSEVGQNLGAVRARDVLRQVDHPHVGQGVAHGPFGP